MPSAGNSQQPFVQVLLENRPITDRVRSVEVEDNDRLIDKVTVVLDDTPTEASSTVREGQRVQVALGWGTEHTVLFEGLTTRSGTQDQPSSTRQTTIVAYDMSYLLNQTVRPSRDFTSGTLSTIVDQLLVDYPLPVGQIKLEPDPSFTEQRRLRQVNKTDWQFLQDLALEFGARCFVEYNEGRSRFYFVSESVLLQGDALGKFNYCAGVSKLIQFSYQRVASAAAPQRSATTTDPVTGAIIPPLPGTPTPPETAPTAAPPTVSSPDAQRRQQDTLGAASNPNLPEQTARRDPTRILGFFGEGLAVGNVNLRAKGKLTIDGIAPWAAGDWYIRKVVHTYTRERASSTDRSTYYSRFVVTR